MSTIPDWNTDGFLPPVDILHPASFENRSPYKVTSKALVERFALNRQRCKILHGFLKFRAGWYKIGLTNGIQWINGSFVENKEQIKSVPPNDIDIATIAILPEGVEEGELQKKNPELFNRISVRKKYLTDSLFILVDDEIDMNYFLDTTVYWSGLWSHTREYAWKGFLEVPFSPGDDKESLKLLKIKQKEFENDDTV